MNNIDAELAHRILSAFVDSTHDTAQYIYSSSDRFYSTNNRTVVSINKSLVDNHSELTDYTVTDSSITNRLQKSFDLPLDISIKLLDNEVINQIRHYLKSIISLSDTHGRDATVTLLYDDLLMSTVELYTQSTSNPYIISMDTDNISTSNSRDGQIVIKQLYAKQLYEILNLFANSDSLKISISNSNPVIRFTGANIQAVTATIR